MTPALECSGLRKVYHGGDGQPLEVLGGVDLVVTPGEFVAVVGESGCGKSTLLHILGALDTPTSGTVRLGGIDLAEVGPAAMAQLRNRRIGFVFQFHHLLREFSALENTMMPLLISGLSRPQARDKAAVALERVGLAQRLEHRPAQLSGGEQQRVALARAVVAEPEVVLADEPSGNLDHGNSVRLHEQLVSLVRDLETALVVVTHERQLASLADRLMVLAEGRLHALQSAEAMP